MIHTFEYGLRSSHAQLGMTMEEGEVVEWTTELGEEVEVGDLIGIIESEKTTNDVEAREDGQVLEHFVEPLESVEPGDPIAYVGAEGESVPDDIESEAESAGSETAERDDSGGETQTIDQSTKPETTMTSKGDAKVSPRARTYARDNDVEEAELADLQGSGPDGAVVEADVVEAVDALSSGQGPAASTPDRLLTSGDVSVSGRDIYQERGDSGLRKTIANRMTESAKAPQVTLNRRTNVDSLLDLKAGLEEDRGLKLSVTDFLLSAVVDALSEYPEFNGIYEDGVHKLAGNVNLGIAVDMEDGLVTPVIDGADRRTITELREERQRLVSLVQSDEYAMDDLSDGTFTVTNLGHFGVESFDPLLNPPQVAILGVGGIRTEYDPEADEPCEELGLSLTFDHRAVDGADAARFLETLVDALEHPLGLISFGREQGSQLGDQGPFLETADGPEGDRVATTKSAGGMQATVRSRDFEWAVDEPEDQGGEDTAPNPVEQFVGSLSSCLTLMIGHMADRREVDLDDVTVTAQAEPPEGRIERIAIAIQVVSDADRDAVEQVVEMAERACYVNQVIDDDVERDLNVTIQ